MTISTDIERRRELTLGPIAPWHTTITVDAVSTRHGRQSSLPRDWRFEVQVEWFGPPAVGFPPSPTAVSARDVYSLQELEDAIRLAHQAAEAFARGGDEVPDLRDLVAAK